eukprot:78718_1
MATASKRRGSMQYVPVKVQDSNKIVKDLPTPIVHLKGFVSGIDFRNDNTKHLLNSCLYTLRSMLQNGGTLVWDGNLYKNSSFTYIIPLLFNELFNKKNVSLKFRANPDPKWVFLGFCKQSNLSKFHNSWLNKLQTNNKICIDRITTNRIQFFIQPLQRIYNFIDLRMKSLNITKSKLIICFGGGVALKHEYKKIINPNNDNPWPNFYVFGVGKYKLSKTTKQKQFEITELKSLFSLNENNTKYVAKKHVLKIAYFDAVIDEWSKDIINPISIAKTLGYIAHKEQKEQKSNENSYDMLRAKQFNMTYDPKSIGNCKKGWTTGTNSNKRHGKRISNVNKPQTEVSKPKPTQSTNPYLDESLMQSLRIDFSTNKNKQFETQFNKKK